MMNTVPHAAGEVPHAPTTHPHAPRLLIALLLVLLLPAASQALPAAADNSFDRPQFICLNKGFPGGWLIDDPSTFTQASVDAMLAAVGGQRGGAARKLCLSFNAWTLYMSPANETTMLRSVDALLALALANGLPLSLSVDPTQWWQSRPDLYNWWDPASPGYDPANAANVEWTAPSPANATAISWRNWGSQFRMPSPHPNYASPAFREAAAASVRPLGARIAAWYRALPADKKYLLAYVRGTQELWIGTNYFFYPNGNALAPQPPAGDPQGGPAGTMQLGYSAVCGAGAGGPGCSGAPGDALSVAQLDAVVSSLANFLAQSLLDAGLPRSRLMVHTGSFFGGPPACRAPLAPCAFNSPQAALVPSAFPAWSLYGGGTDAAGDAGLRAALDAVDGAPWGACEWLAFFDGGHPQAAWAAALAATQGYRNNRLVVVQNFESIQHDANALAALAAALAAEPACLVDAPTALTAQLVNATLRVTWAAPRSLGGPLESQSLLASTLALTLPSGALASPDVALLLLPGNAAAAEVALPAGFDASEVFLQVIARGCAGTQSLATDAVVVETRVR